MRFDLNGGNYFEERNTFTYSRGLSSIGLNVQISVLRSGSVRRKKHRRVEGPSKLGTEYLFYIPVGIHRCIFLLQIWQKKWYLKN